MDQKIILAAKQQLDLSIAKIESKKPLTPAARIMLEAIVLESLTARESEWKGKNILLEAYGSEASVRAQLSNSLNEVLSQAYIDQQGDWITTRDLLSAIQKKWCGIFPIC